MARAVLTVEGLAKSFAARTLFEDVTFAIEEGERVALVGPNGAGKSTLIDVLAGRQESDHGSVRFARDARVTLFTQHADVPKDALARDLLALGAGVPPELAEEMSALEARMADPALYESPEMNEVIARFGEVQREVALAKAASAGDPEENPLLPALGFDPTRLDERAASLSGGERTKVLLARALAAADPSGLLVLDEPTNHLDVESIEWLEEWLTEWKGTALVVAHDRAFLDNVATRVLAFERGTLESYPGNYTAFEAAREADEARLALQREREAKELDRQKAVIQQFRHQKRFNGQMASRLQRLEKYRTAIDRTADPLFEKVQFAVGFGETFKSSNEVVRIRGLAKKYGERILFYDLNFDVSKGDRIAITGPNGAGKTTLLRILTGKEKKELGTVEVPPGVKGAYYAQGNETLDVKRTLREEVLAARPGLVDEDVKALLGRFGFRDDQDPTRKVATLSGGERARLSLLKVVIAPSNLLILDEPTNHLDILSRGVLARALNAYQGTLLVVSHDRWFLDSVVNKVAVVGNRQLRVFGGDFTEAREAAAMEAWGVAEKPVTYVVRKSFKDFDSGTKHNVGSTLALTQAELEGKRLYRTALAMGWMEEDSKAR